MDLKYYITHHRETNQNIKRTAEKTTLEKIFCIIVKSLSIARDTSRVVDSPDTR